MRYQQRTEPLHEVGECNELDVMVVRGIDLRQSRMVRLALENLREQTGGLILPSSIAEIPLPIYGSDTLKRAVLESSKKSAVGKKGRNSPVVSVAKLDTVCDEIQEEHDFGDLTLDVLDPENPFCIDEYDQLVVALDQDNPSYVLDQEKIHEIVESRNLNTCSDEDNNVTYFKPPTLVIGQVERHALGFGEEHERFMSDPNAFIAEQMYYYQKPDKDGFIDRPQIFPEQVCFGGISVVARRRLPASFPKLTVIETTLPGRYDGIRLIRGSDTEDELTLETSP